MQNAVALADHHVALTGYTRRRNINSMQRARAVESNFSATRSAFVRFRREEMKEKVGCDGGVGGRGTSARVASDSLSVVAQSDDAQRGFRETTIRRRQLIVSADRSIGILRDITTSPTIVARTRLDDEAAGGRGRRASYYYRPLYPITKSQSSRGQLFPTWGNRGVLLGKFYRDSANFC